MPDGGAFVEKAKLPFANYDIVVYFGVGICSLPFFYRYFFPRPGSRLPAIFNGYNDSLINSAVSIVSLTFGVYILGHGIALLSSLLIERFLYRFIGEPSYHVAKRASNNNLNHTEFRNELASKLKIVKAQGLYPADIIRLTFHIPALPVYVTIYSLRLFGFYESKVNQHVVARMEARLKGLYDYPGNITDGESWFKIVEYACANDHPVAMAKMYNYMMMYGLFRSVSFLSLCAIWLELFYWYRIGGIGFLDAAGSGNLVVRLMVLLMLYAISFVGFAKFSRRYTEEAIQAFALSKSFEVPSS